MGGSLRSPIFVVAKDEVTKVRFWGEKDKTKKNNRHFNSLHQMVTLKYNRYFFLITSLTHKNTHYFIVIFLPEFSSIVRMCLS